MADLKRIEELCKRDKISIAALERRLDFANGSLRKSGLDNMSYKRAKAVADYFGVSMEELDEPVLIETQAESPAIERLKTYAELLNRREKDD